MIDLHNHILPGLDDGPDELDDAITMCRLAAADGVTTVVATPHMCDGVYNVTREQVFAGVSELRQELASRGISLAVEPGADVHIEVDLDRRLRDREVVTIGDRGKHVLVELPPDQVPRGLDQVLFAVQVAGIVPVLSHPERNLAVQEDPRVLVPLVEAGHLTQVTAGSIEGRFGRRVQRCARILIERRLAHLVASDAHSPEGRPPGLSGARRVVESLLPAAEAEDMFVARPERILAGEYVELPEVVDDDPPKRRRWIF